MNRKENNNREAAPSLADFVYQEILRAIRSGKYHPGERIREAAVTKELDVSRTPVREAFRRLQSEGRLKVEPQKGAVVAELDRQEVAELYALRQQLEGVAARFAAQHASDAEIDTMEFILEKSRKASDDPRLLNQINWELHHAIYSSAHNRFLTKVFASIADPLALLRGVKYIPKERPQELHSEHQKIIEAIRERNPEAADKAAQKHIKRAYVNHLEAGFHERSRDQ